jgi:hypothetical protein
MNVIDPPAFMSAAPYLAALNAPQKRMSIAGRSDALSGVSRASSATMPAVMNM